MALVISGHSIGTSSYPNAIAGTHRAGGLKRAPLFSVCSTGRGQAVPHNASNIWTFNTVISDPYSNYNTTTFRYTIPITGIYIFTFYCLIGGGVHAASVYKNGAVWNLGLGQTQRWVYTGSGVYWNMIRGTMIGALTAGDYVDVRTNSEATGQIYNEDLNGWSGHFIGEA